MTDILTRWYVLWFFPLNFRHHHRRLLFERKNGKIAHIVCRHVSKTEKLLLLHLQLNKISGKKQF